MKVGTLLLALYLGNKMSNSVLIQIGRIFVSRNEILAFTVSFIISALILLYLFRFWFIVYIILFFISAWTLVAVSSKRTILRTIALGYFLGYVLSAGVGFLFLGVE